MRDQDKQALALVIAGALFGFIPTVLTLPGYWLYVALMFLSTLIILSLLYGAGTIRKFLHRRRIDGRWNQPMRIGLLQDMDDPSPSTSLHSDVKISEWKVTFKKCAKEAGASASVEKITVASQFDHYGIILNPYGGIYPEQDLKSFPTLEKIINYVREGGLFVNVADIPTYQAYDANLKRSLDVTEAIFGMVIVNGTLQPVSSRPFELSPLPKALGLRIGGARDSTVWTVSLKKVLGEKAPDLAFTRAAIVETNVDPCVEPIDLQYVDGNNYKMTPFFFAKYGEGEFLISLAWFDLNSSTKAAKDVLVTAICKLAIHKVAPKLVS